MRKHWPIIVLALLGCALAAGVAAFNEPTEMPPEGTVSSPILTGLGNQVRNGPLSLGGLTTNALSVSQGGLASSGNFTITNNVPLCLNGSGADHCILSWSEILNNFVRLSPGTPDQGYIHLNGSASFTGATNAFAGLRSYALPPTDGETYGFSGTASADAGAADRSYGILGVAGYETDVIDRMAYGIFGWDGGNANAYAGYFNGRVEVAAGSLICFLNGPVDDCQSVWPDGPADEPLRLQTALPTVLQAGWTAVDSAARFTIAVLGDPAGHSSLVTCGDGVCTEGAASCPADCPVLSVPAAAWQSATTATVTWTSNTLMSSIVQFGTTSEYGSQIRDDSPTGLLSHSLLLEGLDSAQTYHYRAGGQTTGSGVTLFSADAVLEPSLDITPPDAPSSLSYSVFLPAAQPPPGTIRLAWAHPLTDKPPVTGLGFDHFNIYRKLSSASEFGSPIASTQDLTYFDSDPSLVPNTSYVYAVSAVDKAVPGNESNLTLLNNVYLPNRCTGDAQCSGTHPRCCDWPVANGGGKACAAACGGGSPIMDKTPGGQG